MLVTLKSQRIDNVASVVWMKKKAEVNHFIPMIKKVYVLNQQPHRLFVAGHKKPHEN